MAGWQVKFLGVDWTNAGIAIGLAYFLRDKYGYSFIPTAIFLAAAGEIITNRLDFTYEMFNAADRK